MESFIPDDPQTFQRLHRLFREEVKIVEEIQKLVADRHEPYCDVLFPLLYSVVDSSHGFWVLTRHRALRNSYVIARVAFETIVNACFILTKGNEAAERARQHARQKMLRDMDRELEMNGQTLRVTCTAKDKLGADPAVQAAVAAFTSKKGREITQWTEENVKERIDAVGAKFGRKADLALSFCLLAVYRHGSEIAHGSYFGALFSLGMTQPRGDQDFDKYSTGNLSMLLFLLRGALDSLIYVIQQEMGLSGFYERSQAIYEECRQKT